MLSFLEMGRGPSWYFWMRTCSSLASLTHASICTYKTFAKCSKHTADSSGSCNLHCILRSEAGLFCLSDLWSLWLKYSAAFIISSFLLLYRKTMAFLTYLASGAFGFYQPKKFSSLFQRSHRKYLTSQKILPSVSEVSHKVSQKTKKIALCFKGLTETISQAKTFISLFQRSHSKCLWDLWNRKQFFHLLVS